MCYQILQINFVIVHIAWDQTNGVMKIYITDLKDVQKLSAENVTSEFKDRSVSFIKYD